MGIRAEPPNYKYYPSSHPHHLILPIHSFNNLRTAVNNTPTHPHPASVTEDVSPPLLRDTLPVIPRVIPLHLCALQAKPRNTRYSLPLMVLLKCHRDHLAPSQILLPITPTPAQSGTTSLEDIVTMVWPPALNSHEDPFESHGCQPRHSSYTTSLQGSLPGLRCPTCAAQGKEVWVIPGRRCGYCGTPVG